MLSMEAALSKLFELFPSEKGSIRKEFAPFVENPTECYKTCSNLPTVSSQLKM